MISALLSGLRSLRISLVTGGILVGSSYIFLYETVDNKFDFRPSALSLLQFSPLVPIILFIALCLIVGSIYATLLEGIMDGLHRYYVNSRNKSTEHTIKKKGFKLITYSTPYSISAEERLKIEVLRFHREYHSDENVSNRTELEKDFVNKVLIETLWMEGKLAGTDLESPYDKIRSEGEMRLAGGLLIPLASTTAAFSLQASVWQMVIIFFIGIALAIPTVNYGLYYYKKANSFLAHHIADGRILSPSMETLKRISDIKPK